MAKNKKQHYVPIFFLRLFSIAQKGLHIKIYQKATGKIIQRGGLKNQAQEKYFYGSNLNMEKWFGEVENLCGHIIKDVAKTEKLPKKNSKKYQLLVLFMLLQAFRTKAQADELNQLTDTFIKTIMKYDKTFENYDFDSFKIGYDDAPVKNVGMLLESYPMMADMEVKIISNSTDIPFITSDNPTFKYNQFLKGREFEFGRTGMGCKGLQIFFPISPKNIILMYDPKVYKVGNRRQFFGIEASVKDVNQINLLMFLNANETIFSNEKATDYFFEKLSQKALKYKDLKKIEVNEYPESIMDESEGKQSILIHQKKNYIDTNLHLSFVKPTPHAKYYELNGTAAELRDLARFFRDKRRNS
ncbi:DUF4238 domain-containing protein [Maribacter sp. SA7]|uniref:DUF4238 domain-containing protein n=1 Tax=Maribacter zhoushanensis TaxID=3030012 RepID=UPI0023EBD0D1|nr:DUF4238 domain-containing protein [Maribacter zhoushanensis]MDF4203845.1 DUF4238 domain-containing protein [Maribacter zhoushanensis]